MDFNDNFSKTSLLLFKLLRAKYKAAYNFKEYLSYINHPVNQMPQNKTHIIERMDYFLKQIGFFYPDELVKPKLYIENSAKLFAQNLLSKYSDKNKIIALNLSAGAEIRYWAVEKWIKLINLIINYDNRSLFIPLCMEKDIKLKNNILSAIDNKYLINLNNYSFQEYAALISKSDFLISPDTSAIHIASSFDVPVLGLYPNPEWNLVSWRPYQKHYKILSSNTEYINEIEPELVFEKFIELNNELKNVKW